MSVRRHTAIAAMVLLSFSTETPAPQVPQVPQVPDAAVKLDRLKELVELQTDAINTLNQKLITIEQRVARLEKEKNHG